MTDHIANKTPRRRRTVPTTAAALGVAGLLGLGAAPIAGAQTAPDTPAATAENINDSVRGLVDQLAAPTQAVAGATADDVVDAANEAVGGIIDTPEAQQALAALRELQGADPNRMATGLVAGGEQLTDFIAELMAHPERLESLAVTVVTDTSREEATKDTATGDDAGEATDTAPTSLQLTVTDTDGQVSITQLDELDPQTAADVAELVTDLAAEITGSVSDDDSVSTAPAPEVGAADVGDGLDALAELGEESGVLDTEDPLTQSVLAEVEDRLNQITDSVPVLDEVLTAVDDLATTVDEVLATLAGDNTDTTSNTNNNTNTNETTVNISFGDGTAPQASVTTNDGEQLTQTRTEATPLQATALAGVLDASVSAQTITEARGLVDEIISATGRGADTGGAEGRLVSLLNAAITTGDEAERAELAQENQRLVDLLVDAAQAHADGETLTVDGEVITELVVTSGNQLVKTLREAITVEMHEAGIDSETTAAVTGVAGEPGEVIVRVPIPRQGAGGTTAGDATTNAESETDDLLERISAALAALSNLDGGNTETDETITQLVDKLAEATTEDELAEILAGLSTEELTALAEVLESIDAADRNSTASDDEGAALELIQAVLDEVPEEATVVTADRQGDRGTTSNAGNSTTAEEVDAVVIDDEALEEVGDLEDIVVVEAAEEDAAAEPEGKAVNAASDGQQHAAPEELAVTGSDSIGVVGVLGALAALVAALAGGAVWWQRRNNSAQ